MITLNEFIERTKPAWRVARGYIRCFDNLDNPKEFKLKSNDWDWKRKIADMGLEETDIKHHVVFEVSNESKNRVGYSMMHVYLRSDKSIICVEFYKCTEAFLNITERLGMVNGVLYKNRINLKSYNSEVFFL